MYNFYCNCVGWPTNGVESLSDMIDEAIDITRRTFLKHVDRGQQKELENQLSYASHPKQGLTMAGDWHVSYHRSMYKGKRVYFFKYSGIEYVFTKKE